MDLNLLNWVGNSVINTSPVAQNIITPIMSEMSEIGDSGYNPNRSNITNFMSQLIPSLDFYMNKYDNFLMLGDFNSEMSEYAMEEFCEIYNMTNLIKEPPCFKNPLNPSTIDLILTNRPRSFLSSKAIETGLSDHHKLTITVFFLFTFSYLRYETSQRG